jgi:selenocysteine lyase/cysteine desulfurase
VTDPGRFRDQFPVLESTAYLNAGTEGPVPRATVEAVRDRLERDAARGRAGRAYFDEVMDLATRSRAGYAAVLGARPEEVALTGSTTDGVNTVLGGLRFRDGDEILTTDEEHPGLLAPLRLARIRYGVSIRVVPFAELAEHAGPRTRLIACSHVSWVGGKVADVAALVSTGVPVLLDAAQALGAIPVDVHALGCDYYAASGQKWLCGPEGSGSLFVRPDRLDDLEPPWPGYATLSDHDDILGSGLAEGAPRLDNGFPSAIRSTWALASLQVLEQAGWSWVHQRAGDLADQLAGLLIERGVDVAPRGRSTLVSWSAEDPEEEVRRLAGAGFVVRSIPVGGLMRAAVGAWSSEGEIERLADAAAMS